jgi:hypothetical protein
MTSDDEEDEEEYEDENEDEEVGFIHVDQAKEDTT